MRFLLLLCCFLCPEVASAQDIVVRKDFRVLVLDALDGKPQSGVEISYLCVGKPRNSPSKPTSTNQEGVAEVPYSCGDEQGIELQATAHKKEQCGGFAPVAFKNIESVGVISKPDADGGIWCPTKVSKKMKPVPGQVIMFVKKPTWWQSHVAG